MKSPDWPKCHEYLMICVNIFSSPKKQTKTNKSKTRPEKKGRDDTTRDDTRRDKMKQDNEKEVYLLVKKDLQ